MAQATKKTANGAARSLPPSDPPARSSGGAIQLYREVVRETSKVTWPSWKETWMTTVIVFIMVAFLMLFFFFADSMLALGERWLIGAG